MSVLYETANRYLKAGLSVIPIKADGSKAPAMSWKAFQSQLPSATELKSFFPESTTLGIAIVAGAVSGHLEVLDFDDADSFDRWTDLIVDCGEADLLNNLPLVKTPSGGHHVYYRCSEIQPNQKLAQRLAVDGKLQVLIETRGEGGYVLAPGSSTSCHGSGKPYELRRNTLEQVPEISADQRFLLLASARSLNEYVPSQTVAPNAVAQSTNGTRPGDIYNVEAIEQGLTEDLLQKHGWRKIRTVGHGSHWQKPGSQGKGIHATLGVAGAGMFYNFSTAAAPFEACHGYDPFAVLAHLEHGGDFTAAARALAEGTTRNSDHQWAEVKEIETECPPVEQLMSEMLPAALSEHLVDIAHRMQCPLDFVACAALVMVGAIVGAGCGIKPKRKDDWLVIPNLWGGVVARPGQLKSPALEEALRPLSRLEAKAREAFEKDAVQHDTEELAYETARAALKEQMKSAAKKTGDGGDQHINDLKAKSLALKQPALPVCRRYRTNDATIEKMSELLQENPRGIFVFRDELIGQLKSWEREGREQDRAFYLEAWNGSGSFTTDRIGRGTVHVPNMCVSLFGGIQPAKLTSYLHEAINGQQNDGLVQRLQLMVCPDDVSSWKLIDEYPNRDAKERTFSVIEKLAEADFTAFGADGADDHCRIPFFRFSEEAQQLFYRWLTELETNKLRQDDEPIILEHLSKYRSLLPSLALLFHLVDVADGAPPGPVSAGAFRMAECWCGYLESHARRIYGLVLGCDDSAAVRLLQAIKNGALKDGFTARDVQRKGWARLSQMEAVSSACETLIHAGWLRSEVIKPTSGGRPTTRYLINTEAMQK